VNIHISGFHISEVTPSEQSHLFINGREYPLPNGCRIFPGFVDTHCHLIGLGLMASRVDLRGARSARECAERMAEAAAESSPGVWVRGFGWNQEEWGDPAMPDRAILDECIPNNPVVLQRVDSHAVWINSRAMDIIGDIPEEIPGGEILRDASRRATGIFVDNATDLVERVIPLPSVEQQIGWLNQSVERCLAFGITEIHDMNVEPSRLESMTRLAERGGMRLRCNVFLAAMHNEWHPWPQPTELAANLAIVGVKYFADGALGSRGALLLEPYSDAPETLGLALLSVDELVERARPAIEVGFAVATHAIGDGANRLVLDAYELLRRDYPAALLRIEHAQIVHPDDLPRFGQLGVVAAVQSVHCTSDATMAERRLGRDRCQTAYRWRSLIDQGVPVIGGSDFPIESVDPATGLRAFVHRTPDGTTDPEAAWCPEEKITPAEALAAYTSQAPAGVPRGANRGTIHVGCDADLVVVEGDVFTPGEGSVVATIVAGRLEYERP
jgi:predicted amidohydrolase YtcJ